MDELTRKRVIELYKSGRGINAIAKIFKIKKNEINKIIKDIEGVGQRVGQSVGQADNVDIAMVLEEGDKSKSLVAQEYNDTISYLDSNIEILKHMLEAYKEKNLFKQQDNSKFIEIRLPNEEESYKTSIRVNRVIMEQFREFCNIHKEFTSKDLLSMALVEYMEKYK